MTNITLIKGVTGGFVKATPTLHILLDTKKDIMSIAKSVPSGNDFSTSTCQLKLADYQELLTGWEAILKELPEEEPRGCEDIYGFDYSIQYRSGTMKWANTPNEGCSSTPSSKQPSEDQKRKFKSIVDDLEKLAEQCV